MDRIGYNKYYWLNDESRKFLSRGYLKEGISPEQRIKDISAYAEKILNLKGFAQKFENYMERGFYSLSSPVWSNFGYEKSLPISCYGSHIDDSMDSILNANREVGLMTKYGGGTSMYLGNIRSRGTSISAGGLADGPVHYAKITDSIIDVCKQGDTRRGACAIYLPVEHDDILEFLDIGGEGHPIQNLQFGVTATDEWLQSMIDGDEYKRQIWAKVLKKRNEIGFPYICLLYTSDAADE